MATYKSFQVILFISAVYFICKRSSFVEANDDRKDYIVYMGSKTEEYSLTSDHHLGILRQVLEKSTPKESLIISYGRSFNGFAAKLTFKEVAKLQSMPRVVSVFPSRRLELQTTRSWDFLGLPESAPGDPTAERESNVIIGHLDTGIWPESPSFRDDGMGPVPSKWKGVCQGGHNFTCNRKVIGARAYSQPVAGVDGPARDLHGHGSHTASIAAGRSVKNTSFFGIANGTARGGSPFARLAVYRVCARFCSEFLILAAFDDAIADGVDIITISIGGDALDFSTDSISIGSFHALQKGILTVQSAGNNGNVSASTGSVAPWVFTVAASSTDRRIIDKFVLGNGTTFTGSNINPFTLKKKSYPLVLYQGMPPPNSTAEIYKGKIAIIGGEDLLGQALAAGAAGALTTNRRPDVSHPVPLPAVALSANDFGAVIIYTSNTTTNARGTILKSVTITDKSAPVVASFSSRGPNEIAPDILKPDIAAPGVEILAAYSPLGKITKFPNDKTSVTYSILYGTSMACPHVSATAANLKSLHPDWSPSAIKSAIMTTALPMNRTKNSDGEFAYGAGNLNPTKAADPGLVYETTRDDYLSLMCNLGYTDTQIKVMVGKESYSCPKQRARKPSPVDVNYPTMSAKVDYAKPFNLKFSRTVTNVGVANSTYTAKVESDLSIRIRVEPNTLSFKALKEVKSFKVTVAGDVLTSGTSVSGSLVWSDGIHNVRSPIVIYI
ncbi:hypothetical protein vseg_014131 [Gypsophila vaccaria]